MKRKAVDNLLRTLMATDFEPPAGTTRVRMRTATESDLPRLTEICNHYVQHTTVTFDIEAYTVEHRAAWFRQFAAKGRYRLIVAEEDGAVLDYADGPIVLPRRAPPMPDGKPSPSNSPHRASLAGLGRTC